MGDKGDDPDPGGGDVLTNPVLTSALPVTSVWADDRKSADDVKLRSFEEIINDATNNRNILNPIRSGLFFSSQIRGGADSAPP